jgi:hypothetical protein
MTVPGRIRMQAVINRLKYIPGYVMWLAMFISLSCGNYSDSSIPCTKEGDVYFAKHILPST